ncbi:macrophage mannose receptor 1-like isoform X2 [Plectropomus leopardus]|uniref:macrophage mannose receptor 1-like isoform X2 n=1 Tax=Plectropomus leopardus TaxID=160734 RepID=UPI001C4CE49A|nr:macrophage mannose receptor 1-like isoform X2 [Plectropomus leopardus]
MSAALRLIRRMLTQRITLAAFVLLIPTSECLTRNDSPFALTNKATGFCLVKRTTRCLEMRWTTGDRLFVTSSRKCLGAQGKTVGSEVSLYDCDEKSELQRWECKNETLLVLKGQQLYIEVRADESVALSKTSGPNNEFTIQGTASGACSRTYRELYTIEGNAFGKICMFPFLYKDRWFGDCTTYDSSTKRQWCAIGTKYDQELWGYCPTTSTDHWAKNAVTGSFYQLNTQAVLTWDQAATSCKQQGGSLLSITDPNEQAFISALVGTGKHKLWIGVVLDPEHGWQWSDRKPFRYLRWSTGNPLPNPGHNCAFLDTAGQHMWQSSTCGKKLGYICYKDGAAPAPPQIEQGHCATPWIPYNGHCFQILRTPTQTWSGAQKACRKEEGDLVSIRNVEDQSFVISQLGFASTDELWIGFNDIRTEGLFDWSDHSTVSFTSWQFGKPSVSTDADDCVLITGENGNWADHSCDEKHGFICMKQSTTEVTGEEVNLDLGCKAGWKRHGSYCYFVGTETKTFDEAKDDCKTSDSYLADVSNGVDNAFLASLVGLRPEKYFWLGLSNQKNIDQFVWTNTDSVKFTHWNAEMPGFQQGCVAMTTGVLAGLWDLLPCTNKEKYICKHLAEGAVLTAAPPTQTPPKCEEGWNRVGTRSMCSKFFTGPRSDEKTWFEARDYCRAIGGDLLSIHSSTELAMTRHGRAWIGLRMPDPVTGYQWSDGSALNFQHWQEGEPNNHNNDESCAEFRMYHWDDGGSWNDMNCESYNDWLCQIRAGVTPNPPPNKTMTDYNITSDGWLVWRGNQYYINRNSMAIEDARHYCQKRHGDLVSITSNDENVFIWKQVSRSYGSYYLGLSVDLDGSFWWTDGSPVGLQKWDENQPNSDAFDENCVYMSYYMGFWRTCNCGQEHQFICKRRNSAPVNTTAAPTVPPKGGCPLKWSKFDSKCYSVVTNRAATWEEARRQCITMGGNLVSIPTRRVQAFLTTKMAEISTKDLWIGLNGIKQDGFYWTDGKARRYTNWGYSKHKRRPGTFYQRWNEEDCVIMNSNPTLGTGKWIVKHCNDTNGFVCLRGLDPNLQPQPELPVSNIYVTLANDSIKVVTKNMTWDDAEKQCESENAKLVSLRNEWTQAYVELLSLNLKTPLWIGLNKDKTDGYFKYMDGWHLNSASWAEGEPSRDKPCVYLDMDGKWKTEYCNRTMNSVCMQSTDVAPTESASFPGVCPPETNEDYHQSYTWMPYKGHCYLFITEEIEWADAASSCVRHGGILASIEDPAEQNFIKTSVEIFQDSHSAFWIGLYKTHKGTWKWLDKTVMDYTNWGIDEPDDDYGEIGTSDGAWRTGRRWHDRAYICETPKVMPGESGSKLEPHIGQDPRSRVHTSLVVVLIIAITSSLIVVAFYLYKRSPTPLPTFENPLYAERSQPDVVDTNKLIENAEVENPEPIITL